MERLKNSLNYFIKNNKKQVFFYLFLNCLFTLFITFSSYVHIPLSGFKDHLLYTLHLILLQTSIAGYIYIFTLNKWLIKLVFAPCFFTLSLFSYWVYVQDISITNSLIEVVIETKPSIAFDLLSFQYVIYILLVAVILLIIISLHKKILPVKINLPFLFLTIISIFLFNLIESRRANTFKTRLPYNIFFGIKDYLAKNKYGINEVPKDVYSSVDSLKIVFVLGETVRADHLQINGYNRETTPLLIKRNNVVSFSSIYTPHTYTGSSVPRIISNASVENEVLTNLTSVFDVFNACNYNTTWFGNQELENSFESIVRTNKKVVLIDSLRSYMSFNKALDEELLKPFRNSFLDENKKGLYTLHMIGSHWWYENRYSSSFRKFKPVIKSKHIPSSTEQEIINSYDNTICYLDNFLNQIINTQDSLKLPSVMIYMSDHGEVLGEEGKWLHAQDSKYSMNPAMIIWYSNEFEEKYPNKVKALKANSNKEYTTDLLYHSLLDLLEVKNISFIKEKSILKD